MCNDYFVSIMTRESQSDLKFEDCNKFQNRYSKMEGPILDLYFKSLKLRFRAPTNLKYICSNYLYFGMAD